MLSLDAVLQISLSMFAALAPAAEPAIAPAEPADPDATDRTDADVADAVGESPGSSSDIAAQPSPDAAPLGELRSELNNKCLDIAGVDPNSGAHVIMWDCWGGANQRWYTP
jgi:hypothetical protein